MQVVEFNLVLYTLALIFFFFFKFHIVLIFLSKTFLFFFFNLRITGHEIFKSHAARLLAQQKLYLATISSNLANFLRLIIPLNKERNDIKRCRLLK